jgi:ArsR family transcriptional regulator
MLDHAQRNKWVEIFAALASESRLRITEMLAEGRVECQEILRRFELSQPAISYHLAKLERAGVLIKERNGPRNCYRLNSHIRGLIKILTQEENR